MNKTTELYESPKRQQNENKYGILAGPQCICCMKPIETPKSAYSVHMNTDWLAVHPSISEDLCAAETGSESQGWFDIGPECAKKMQGFVIKNK